MNIETKIAAILAPLGEAREVVYTVQGEDQQYTFTAPDAAAAGIMMAELHAMAQFQPVAAHYADDVNAPKVTTVPPDAGEPLPERDYRIGFGGGF